MARRIEEITNEDLLVALIAAIMQKDLRIGPKIAKSCAEEIDFSTPHTEEDDLREFANQNRFKAILSSELRLFLAHRKGASRRAKTIRSMVEEMDDLIEQALILVTAKINFEVHKFVHK